MKCAKVRSLLSQFLDGDLSPRQSSEIERHIKTCSLCAGDLEKLKQALSLLETEPAVTEVDLYARFCSRLEEKGTPKIRPNFRRAFRTLAIAACVTSLIIGGTFVGKRLEVKKPAEPEKFGVSELRLDVPARYSSVAVAAERMEDRYGTDQCIESEPKFQGKIDVAASGEQLSQVLQLISKRVGVEITACPEIASQRVFLRLKNQKVSDVLSDIRRFFDLDWKTMDGPSGRSYSLVFSERSRKMESAARACFDADMLRRADDMLRRMKRACETGDRHLLDGSSHPLQDDFATRDPKWNNDDALFLLTDNAITTLLDGDDYIVADKQITEKQRRYFEGLMDLSATVTESPDPKHPGKYTYKTDRSAAKLEIKREPTGDLTFYNSALHGNIYGFPLVYVTNPGMDFDSANVWRIYDAAKSANPAYRDPRLGVSLQNSESPKKSVTPADTDYGDEGYTVPDMLNLIADNSKLQIMADYFTAYETDAHIMRRKLPENLTLGQLLAVMDRAYNISWSLTDGTLYLTHRAWPYLRDSEPDWKVIADLKSEIKQFGRVDLEGLAEAAKLSPAKLEGTSKEFDYLKIGSGGDYYLSNTVKNDLPLFRFYGSLSTEQRRLAETPRGLSSSLLSKQQQRLMISNGELFPFTFQILRLNNMIGTEASKIAAGHYEFLGSSLPLQDASFGRKDWIGFRMIGRLGDSTGGNWVNVMEMPDRVKH